MAFTYLTPPGFESKVSNFPEESYDVTNVDTHIFKYMWTLLEVGVKFLEVIQQIADDGQGSLSNTKFGDLDLFSYLGISRLNEELYTYDPYMKALPLPTIHEIFTKDSLFRTRIIKFANAVQRGGSPEGIKLMAEAACGYPCQVYEYWRHENATSLYSPLITGACRLKVDNEFIIMPLFPINANQRAVIFHMMQLIQPVNTICSITQNISPYIEISSQWAASSSHFYEAFRRVTADSTTQSRPGGWMQPNMTVDAPVWVYKSTQDYSWSYNADVTSAKAFESTGVYETVLGSITSSISSDATEMIVSETAAPQFNVLYGKIDDEYVLITDKQIGLNNTFKYTIKRAQLGSLPVKHSQGSLIFISAQQASDYTSVATDVWSSWIPIPLADAPKNRGGAGELYPNDPSKIDKDGNYIYDWDSQYDFDLWFRNKIISIGGEVNGREYRIRGHNEVVPIDSTTPREALAPPVFRVSSSIYPM